MDLQMRMNWCRDRFTISDITRGIVKENGVSSVLESKVLIHAEWSVWIGWIWGCVFEVLGTWDDKLSESL